MPAVGRAPTADELHRAFEAGELRLDVQPKVDLRDGSVTGVEALVRWQHPEQGLLLPDEFLPLATSCGLMVALGEWVLDEAIALAARWSTARQGEPMRVWVNLATEQLVEGVELCSRVQRALDDGTITARSIGFEVTESTLLDDLPAAVGVLSSLRRTGFEIALDDFGTGYASLWYLRQLPVTCVKIDRSFVAGIGGSLTDEAIVAAVIDLAHALGLRVVAEGIEELHQADRLIEMGAERAQGFYFGRPQPPELVEQTFALAWCGAAPPTATRAVADRRADAMPGYGSPRARLLLTALDSAHDSILVTSATGRVGSSLFDESIVYVNAAFEAETGHRASDVIGKPVSSLHAAEVTDDVREWMSRVGRDGAASSTEIVSTRADGSLFVCETTVSPIVDERGVHTHWLHVSRDMTQRRAAEGARARFEGLMEQSTSLVFLAEPTGEWIYANAAQRRAIGLALDAPLTGVTTASVLTDEQRRLAPTDVEVALEATGSWSGETAFRNVCTGEMTEVASDLQLVDDPLRPGLRLYASVSREIGDLKALERAERRRRELSGYAADVATRALALGRDEVLGDLDDSLGAFGAMLGADLVYLDIIDRDAGLLVPQGGWSRFDDSARASVPPAIELHRLEHWVEHVDQLSELTQACWSEQWTPWMVELDAVFPGGMLDSRLYAPLRAGGELIGVLGVANADATRIWTTDEIGAVQQVADAFTNLLDRRRANDALKASEARLSAMLASIGDLLVVVDRTGTIRYVNSRAEEALGFAPDELIARRFLDLVNPDDHALAIDAFAQTMDGVDDLPVVELRITHRSGEEVWFDIDSKGGEDPLLGGYMLSLRDVTAQRVTQENKRRHAEVEQVVLELSQWALEVESEDIIAGLSPHLERMGRALGADSAFAALLESDRVRNVAGWKSHDSPRLSYAFPAGNRAVPAVVARYRTLEPLIVSDIDDHTEEWADEWRSFPVPDRAGLNVPLVSGGKCLGNIGVAMARAPRVWKTEEIALVTRVSQTVAVLLARHRAEDSLRTSEARLAALLDSSQDLVVVVDATGVVTYANRAVERSLGYSPERLLGLHVSSFIHSGDWVLAAERLGTLLNAEDTPTTSLRLVRADGSVGWWEITAGTPSGPVADGRVLSCREVTDRLATEFAAATRMAHLRYGFELAQSALDIGPHEFLQKLPIVCEEIASMLDADMVYVDQLDVPARQLVNRACFHRADRGSPAIAVGEAVDFDEIGDYVERLSRPDPVIATDLLQCDEPWATEKARNLGGERSLMAVGMSAAGELFGLLGVSMYARPRVWTEDEVTLLRIVGETVAHVLERARLDEALRASETRFRLLSDTAADVVVLVDATGTITYVSPSSYTLLGFTPEELIGRNATEMIHPDHTSEMLPILSAPKGTKAFTTETQLIRADGTAVWVASSTSIAYEDDGRPSEFRSSLRDITDRKRLESQLEQQALHDPLTGLANRALLKSSLTEATLGSHGDQLAVLLLDLDGFKSVNDTYGHAVGDEVLQTIATRLRGLTRATDTLARAGGDEFVLICPGVDEATALSVGERIVIAVSSPVLVGGAVIELGVSVGVAHGSADATDADRLLLDADRAMYAAKRSGRGRVHLAAKVTSTR